MKENVLFSAGHMFTEIPRETWEKHVEQTPKGISKMLGFMTGAHHTGRSRRKDRREKDFLIYH